MTVLIRLSSRRRALAAAIAIAVAGSAGAYAYAEHHASNREVSVASNGPVSRNEVISPLTHVTLSPLSSSPSLTADEAWAAYAKSVTGHPKPIPADVTYSLGALTFPPHIEDTATYAFLMHMPCHNPQLRCNDWTFLQADSGRFISDFETPESGG